MLPTATSQILASIVLFKSERDKTEAHILTYPDYTEKPDYSVPIESLRITAIIRIGELNFQRENNAVH